jgi:hypothetical protein|tara:strand:+ start:85 stop:657 length:573 start_codon:yes stop_codon:yes gene_type:complete
MIRHLLAITTIVIVLLAYMAHANANDRPVSHIDQTTAVLLARSCVGESGWNSYATGECAAILWVYARRAKIVGTSLRAMAKRYSSALKRHNKHMRPWLFELEASAKRPKSWPRGLWWVTPENTKEPSKRDHWKSILALVESWSLGKVANPIPEAIHYGGVVDRGRARANGMKKIATSFETINDFYKLKLK